LYSHLLSKNTNIKIHKSIILPFVLYGCRTWYFTLKEKHRLRVFKKRVLRRIFRPKKDEVSGDWRKLHNEHLHTLYSLNNIKAIKSRRTRCGTHVACMGRGKKCKKMESLNRRDHPEDLGTGGRIILK
jgi:hypothetical protein